MATEKPTVVEALSKVMAAVQAVGKKDRNREQNYSFRGIDAVVNAVGPELRNFGVVVVPVLHEASYRDVLTTKEKRSRECTVRVTYRFYGPAGDFIEATVPGESMDFGDKGAAKAMSVAYRIVLLQALCIPTDEPEPDSQTYERAREDEWEAAKPATTEQAAEFDALMAGLADAQSRQDIHAVGRKAKAAKASSTITSAQYDRLDVKAGERLAELDQPAAQARPEGGTP